MRGAIVSSQRASAHASLSYHHNDMHLLTDLGPPHQRCSRAERPTVRPQPTRAGGRTAMAGAVAAACKPSCPVRAQLGRATRAQRPQRASRARCLSSSSSAFCSLALPNAAPARQEAGELEPGTSRDAHDPGRPRGAAGLPCTHHPLCVTHHPSARQQHPAW